MEWLARFWPKINRQAANGCWEWLACTNPYGYGKFKIKGQYRLAHRLSWQIHYGTIPDKMCILHKCDNRKCVNPVHLFLGTRSDNTNDRHTKGRSARGSQNGRAKLTEDQVLCIKRLLAHDTSRQKLALKFKVGINAIDKIARGRTWKHLS